MANENKLIDLQGLKVVYDDIQNTLNGLVKKDTVQDNITVTPSLSEQAVTADEGKSLLAKVTVKPVDATLINNLDSDFVAANIKKDVNIFGVTGTFSSTSNGAAPEDILEGKEAFVNGTKVTGNIANVSVTDPAPDLTLSDLIDPSSRFLEIKPNRYNTPTIKALTPGYLGKGPFSADGFKNYIVVNPMDKAVVTLEGTATKGTANIAANSGLSDFTTTTPTDYYVELTTTSGSVIPDFRTNTAGYMGSEYGMEGNITKISTDVPVDGNGSKIYFQVATLDETKTAVRAAFN